MSAAYKCRTCGVITDEEGHLCNPEGLSSDAEFCGSGPEDTGRICGQMDQKLDYQCFTCGRPTEKLDLVCNPMPIR